MSLELPNWPPDWPSIRAAAIHSVETGDWGRYDSAASQKLRDQLADRVVTHAVRLCCSGSVAIELALRAAGIGAAGIGAGDEVITAAFDYPGNVRAIELVGARPVLVDIAEGSPCIDVAQVLDAAGEKVKAVIASHLYGVAADVTELKKICEKKGWTLIEDACQVAGMVIDGKPAGSIGHYGCWSLGGSKLVSCGNGGVVFANDAKAAARLSVIIDRPSDAFALAPLAAAVVSPQLDRLDELNRMRSETAVFLRDAVVPDLDGWTWESGDQDESAFYKVAFSVSSAEHRARILATAAKIGLPMGEGFRSLAKTSQRRCRKPLPLDRSAKLGETLMVLDHRALMIEPQCWVHLADTMKSLV